MRPSWACAALLVAIVIGSVDLRAQTTPFDTIAEARRLRDASDYAGAAVLMRSYVDSHPDDPGSARFAALMAYWAQDQRTADSLYARALTAHGDDADLRLEYGRFLIETGSTARARNVLGPATVDSTSFTPAQVARARALLGTADYWGGDFAAARRQFAAALRLDSSLTDARRQLMEIETASASWIRVGIDGADDDQPIRSGGAGADGAWFATPLTSLGASVHSTMFDLSGVSESILSADARFATYLASAHVDLRGEAGVLQRSFGASNDWTGMFSLGLRLPRSVALRARVTRAPYTSTVSSLAQSIMVEAMEGGLRFGGPRGWMGEVLARRESYPDDNAIATAYAWVLAPILRRSAVTMQLGYAFAAQSAETSRFVPRDEIIVPPGQAPVGVAGEYNPYYTPRNLRAHSVLGALRIHPGNRLTIDADGRYAVAAHDYAPVLFTVVAPPNVTLERRFYRRSFSPWNGRGSVGWAATPAVRFDVGVEHGREAYYTYTSGRLALTYTFVAAAARRADIR